MTPALCASCGSPSHAARDCIIGSHDADATFEFTGSADGAEARSRFSTRLTTIKRVASCGVLRIQADYRDGGNVNVIEGSARGDAGAVILSARCECEVLKVDGISCPASLEESLALEGIAVDGDDRLAMLFAPNPPPLWALRTTRLDVPVAQLGCLFEVRLRLLKPCVPDIALVGRILR